MPTLEPSPMPATLEPMLCTLVDQAFDSPDWIFEPKFDGLRVLAKFDGHELTLESRNHKSQNLLFPEVVDSLRAGLTRPAIVDGEIVCFDDRGRSSFRALQQRFHLADAHEIERRRAEHPASLYLFDILYLDQFDLTNQPLSERKALLREAVTWSDQVRWTDFQPEQGINLWRKACRDGDEGIVAKRWDSTYQHRRSDAWVKIKCVGRQEFVIGGWTDPQRSRVGLGALLVGYYQNGQLHYAGKVGTGYTRETLLDLRNRFSSIDSRSSPFEVGDPPHGEGVHWVKPQLVAEVAYAEWTQNDLLRQPRFEGLRPDKSPHECHRERAKPSRLVEASSPQSNRGSGKSPTRQAKATGESSMPLQEYQAKRNFRKTREPSGKSKGNDNHEQPIFVVQEHHASHLHYDFRLESDGVLKSWAVPKEPTLDPSLKRLAVQVEDHPLGYATFEGTIPQGQYGGGTVSIWDHGTFESPDAQGTSHSITAAIDAGHLEVVLHGERLQGKFALIRMKGRGRGKPQWLLIKMKDEYAAAETTEPQNRQEEDRSRIPPKKPTPRKAARARSSGSQDEVPSQAKVELTHPDKLLFPEVNLSKEDIFNYYDRISDRLLPFLKDRPVTLERLPDGLAPKAPHFWQKDTPASYPSWIPRVPLPNEQGKVVHYVLVNDRETLLYLVNQGTLTFHVGNSRIEHLDQPDYVLFDLDRSQAQFQDVVDVAQALHAELETAGHEAFLKTSGKTGLHVLTPWPKAEGGFDKARSWATEIAERVAKANPQQATVGIRKAGRGRRVYIDVMQNVQGHHAVPPYVLRAVPTATISTPLTWQELNPELDPGAFTPQTIFRRLSRRKIDPFAGLIRSFS